MADSLVFYSKSADVKPGKGVHECVRDPAAYAGLGQHWRRRLSNFDVGAFAFNGRTYMTIEHAFQAAKIALADARRAEEFTVESGTPLGMGDGAAAQRARKLVRLTPDLLRAWDGMKDDVMAAAAAEKFRACPEAAAVLKATGDAQLWHLSMQRGKASTLVRFIHLENIRESL